MRGVEIGIHDRAVPRILRGVMMEESRRAREMPAKRITLAVFASAPLSAAEG